MSSVVEAAPLGPAAVRLTVTSPRIAASWRPGQFVVVRASESGERYAFPIIDGDLIDRTITVVAGGPAGAVEEFSALEKNTTLHELSGPFGRGMAMDGGRLCFVSDGIASSVILPLARQARRAGVHVTTLLGGRTRSRIILEPQLRACSDVLVTTTDDGTHGLKRYVLDALRDALAQAPVPFDRIVMAAPLQTIYAATELAHVFRTPIVIGLHPLMVAGPALCGVGEGSTPCGACGVDVRGEPFSVCHDGPLVNGREVDFPGLFNRLSVVRHTSG